MDYQLLLNGSLITYPLITKNKNFDCSNDKQRNIYSLLVHPSPCVGHIFCSSASPAQSSPPFAGGGLVQVLVLFLEP